LRRCGKKFKNLHHGDCKILAFEVTKILLGALQKIGILHFTSLLSYEKMSKMPIRRGLRALGDCEFPMPFDTVVPEGTHRELAADVVKTEPPQKKTYFPKRKNCSKHVFDQLFFFFGGKLRSLLP